MNKLTMANDVMLAIMVLARAVALIAMIKSLYIADKYEKKRDGYRAIKWLMLAIIFQNLVIWN